MEIVDPLVDLVLCSSNMSMSLLVWYLWPMLPSLVWWLLLGVCWSVFPTWCHPLSTWSPGNQFQTFWLQDLRSHCYCCCSRKRRCLDWVSSARLPTIYPIDEVKNHMKIFSLIRMELLPLTSSWGSSIKVTSAKGILPMLSTRCSFPLWVRVVMMRWLEKRKHCLTDSRSPPPSLMLMPLPLIKRLLPVPPHPESEHR